MGWQGACQRSMRISMCLSVGIWLTSCAHLHQQARHHEHTGDWIMKRDFKSCMLYALFGLPIFLLLFIGVIYFANCGFSTDCSQASLPGIIHTPIPSHSGINPRPGEVGAG